MTHKDFSQEFIRTLIESFTLQPRHALESLDLDITFCISDPSEIFPPATPEASYQPCWRKLASCLKNKDRFPLLRLVKIRINLRLDIERFQEYGDEVFEAFLRGPMNDENFFESTTSGFDVEFYHSIVRLDEQSVLL